MRRHHHGSGRAVVLPDGWDQAHRRVPAGIMPDVVSLRAPGGAPTWSEADHQTEVVPSGAFATGVPARISAIGAGETPQVVDEHVNVAGYNVFLPLDADGVDLVVTNGEANTLLDVTGSLDPTLVGKTLRVTGMVRGSTRFERHLLATLNS